MAVRRRLEADRRRALLERRPRGHLLRHGAGGAGVLRAGHDHFQPERSLADGRVDHAGRREKQLRRRHGPFTARLETDRRPAAVRKLQPWQQERRLHVLDRHAVRSGRQSHRATHVSRKHAVR